MPDWLNNVGNQNATPLNDVAARLIIAFAFGVMIACVYRVARGRQRMIPLAAALVLMTGLICLVTVVIGDNAARAFSLVGALSIVRFRTVVEDIRDTSYVVFAVGIGMTVGSGYILIATIAVPIISGVALLLAAWERNNGAVGTVGVVILKVGVGFSPDKVAAEVFPQYLAEHQLTGAGTAKQGAAIEACYKVRWREPANVVSFVTELNRTEGVQGVEVKDS